MKRYAALCIFLLALATACQNTEQDVMADAQIHDIRMYHQAMALGDYIAAIQATHSLLARDSSQTQYYDTLAMLYYRSGSYPQAAQVAVLMLQKNPKSQKYLEVLARSYQAGGKIDQAAHYYQQLRELTGDPNYDYQLASLNYNAGRMDQAEAIINKIFSTPQIDTAHVKLYTDNGAEQVVHLKAAALNILGSIKYRQRKPDEARQAFTQALQIDSSFELAKNNLKNTGEK